MNVKIPLPAMVMILATVVAAVVSVSYLSYKLGEEDGVQLSGRSFDRGYSLGVGIGKMFASPTAEIEISGHSRLEGVKFLTPVNIRCAEYVAIVDCIIPKTAYVRDGTRFSDGVAISLGDHNIVTNCIFDTFDESHPPFYYRR